MTFSDPSGDHLGRALKSTAEPLGVDESPDLDPEALASTEAEFARYRETHDPGVRDRIIGEHLSLAKYLARRFANRGAPLEELVQVASLGLVKAVDRYDPERGILFATYATHTIVAELKRHFDERGGVAHSPRRMHGLYLQLQDAVGDLGQELGASPTIGQLAAEVQYSEEEVLEALEAGQAYRFASLDVPGGSEDGDPTGPLHPGHDQRVNLAEEQARISPLLSRLPERERLILQLKLFEGMSQSDIAKRLGISQIHVSRLLSRSIARLRYAADTDL